jgi:regulator of replication initiation timing
MADGTTRFDALRGDNSQLDSLARLRSLSEQLDHFAAQQGALASQLRQAEHELAEARAENARLTDELKSHTFTTQTGNDPSQEVAQLRAQIDEVIREIDLSLRHLSD